MQNLFIPTSFWDYCSFIEDFMVIEKIINWRISIKEQYKQLMFVNQSVLLFLTQTLGKQPQKHGKYYAIANINIEKNLVT